MTTPKAERRMIYLACGSDYEWHATMGAFSDKAAAGAFVAELNENGSCNYHVEEFELDAPRERREGAWGVRVNASGKFDEGDGPWWSNSNTPSDAGSADESGAMAFGAAKQTALAKARRALKRLRSSEPSDVR